MEDTGCLVCGLPAQLRCSRCGQGGKDGTGRPIDLRFCSTEHQRLAWPVHKVFCGERAYPIRLPIFRQEDADKVIGIISDRAALERFITAHPNFGPISNDYRAVLGPSVDAMQSNIRSLVNEDHLLMTPSGALTTPTSQHDRHVKYYLNTMSFLNAYVQEAGEPIVPLRASLGAYWALTGFTQLRPDDLWHAHLAHRLLLWSSFSPSGSSAPNPQIGILALVGLQQFLNRSRSDPLHGDAATLILTFLEIVPNA